MLLTCSLLQTILGFLKLPHTTCPIMNHRWLHYVHILMQHTIQECTLDVNVLRLKIPRNTDGKQSSQFCICPKWKPCLKEVNSVDLFKTLSNVSGLETLDLTVGATLYLQTPFSQQRSTTSGQLAEFELSVFNSYCSPRTSLGKL